MGTSATNLKIRFFLFSCSKILIFHNVQGDSLIYFTAFLKKLKLFEKKNNKRNSWFSKENKFVDDKKNKKKVHRHYPTMKRIRILNHLNHIGIEVLTLKVLQIAWKPTQIILWPSILNSRSMFFNFMEFTIPLLLPKTNWY